MFKKYILLCVISLWMTGANAQDVKLNKTKLDEIKQSYEILKLPNLSIVDGIDKGDIYFLKVKSSSQRGSQVHKTFIDKKTGMVYVGEAYDSAGKLMVFPKDKGVVDAGASFSYGNGKKTLYVVTDPECPYCVKFEQEAAGKLDEYTVHVIFYPLPFHKKAPVMIEWIMQAKDDKTKKERLDAVMLQNDTSYKALIKDEGKPFVYSLEVKTVLERSYQAVQELEAQGTPTVYDENLTNIPWKTLLIK